MFDFNDSEQEVKRKNWYGPIGEFVVLFSSLEFATQEWVDLLTDSPAIRNHIIGIWSFKKRAELIIDLVEEYPVSSDQKDVWNKLWRKAIKISKTRNVVAHNPPFENARIEFDENSLRVSVSTGMVEIAKLTKPIGDPGSGLSLNTVKGACEELRELLINLGCEHTGEIVRCEQRL